MSENPNQALVGQESPPATIHVDRSRVRQFARAVGLTDDVFYDEAAARAAGFPGLIAPPTLPIAIGQDAEPGGGAMPKVQWEVRKILHESTSLDFDRPIFAGETLTSKSSLESIATREGKSGVRTVYTMKTDYYDASGKRVCALRLTISEGK